MGKPAGWKHTEEARRKIASAGMGRVFSAERRRKISLSKIGKHRSDETKKKISDTKKGVHSSPQTEFKRGLSPWNKGRTNVYRPEVLASWRAKRIGMFAGEKSPLWKGGITPIHQKIRNSPEYLEWRRRVFDRDDYTCQSCGERGGYLHADHELPFALYPDLRFEVLNGRALCRDCHRKTPTYGGRAGSIF